MAHISQQDCKALCLSIFTASGMKQDDAQKCYNHLIYNELCGRSSHGLVRVKWITDGISKLGHGQETPSLTFDNQSLSIIDGKNHIGLIAVQHGVETAIQKTKDFGITFTGIRNYHTTTGSMYYYNKQILEAGLIGIIGCNSEAIVSHPDGFDPVIGTNPISFAIPATHGNLLCDVTTAAMAYGKIMVMKHKKERVPLGILIDQDGNPSDNPKDAYDGAILPLAGFKGFGLGLAVEMLAGPLIGAKGGRDAVSGSDGLFIIAIDPAALGHNPQSQEQFQAMIDEIKTSRHSGDIEELLIPGERSAQTYTANTQSDLITITDGTYQELLTLKEELTA